MKFLPCPLPYQTHKPTTEDHHHHHHGPDSLSAQPSLPSVPSLTPSQPASVTHHCAAIFKGHNSYVFALALSGKHLFSGSHDNEIRAWSRSAISEKSSFTSRPNVVTTTNGAVKALVVLGDKLFSAHQDHKIRVWRIEQTPQNDAVGGDGRLLRCVATLPTLKDRLLTPFSAKNYVKVRRHVTCTWVHHVDTVSALALSHDGSRLYSASWDRTVKIWRTSDFRCLESIFNAHDDAINAVVVSSDGLVYSGSADRKIKVWRSETRNDQNKGQTQKLKIGSRFQSDPTSVPNKKSCHTLVATLEKHKSSVNALALTEDGSVLYSGACDRSIVVWERKTTGDNDIEMAVVGALRGHKNAILCLAVVGESVVCSGSADKTVRVWRREADRSYACLAVLEGHARPVKSLAVARDGERGGEGCCLVYSGGLDCDIRVWRILVSTF